MLRNLFHSAKILQIGQTLSRSSYLLNIRMCQSSSQETEHEKEESPQDPDDFISDISNPFERKQHTCIICKYNIPLDYKNPRLLSQFVSPYTGFIYGKNITGLCDAQQKRLVNAIKRSRNTGFMPYHLKTAKYIRDPKLFDQHNPSRPNPF